MTTRTQTLAEFLLARITEDEQWVAARRANRSAFRESDQWHVESANVRMLAECEAKRRIVEQAGPLASYLLDEDDDEIEGGWSEAVYLAAAVMQALALPYADHPDYRQEWRP